MKTAIKTLLTAVLTLTVAAVIPSCSKDSQSYPAHLSGTWKTMDASTGYVTTLVIEDIVDGQYAYFTRTTPTKEVAFSSEGSFIYDSTTGKGSIHSSMVGGPVVSASATSSTDSTLDVTVKQVVSAGVQTLFEGTLKKVEEE